MGTTPRLKDVYRGYYFDRDLSLYYLLSRYYDANTGRFISPDDVSYLGANGDLSSYNLYAYCSNNPITYVDPTGGAWIVAKVVGGVVVNVVTSFLGSLVTGQEYKWFNLLVDAVIGAIGSAGGGGLILAGCLDSIASGFMTYAEEKSVGDAITTAAITAVFNFVTISSIKEVLKVRGVEKKVSESASDIIIDLFANLIFDAPSSMMSSAISKAATEGGARP